MLSHVPSICSNNYVKSAPYIYVYSGHFITFNSAIEIMFLGLLTGWVSLILPTLMSPTKDHFVSFRLLKIILCDFAYSVKLAN